MIEKPKEEKTPGPLSKSEQLFDWGTYGGIAGLGVFLGGIPITYWAKYGGGAKLFVNAAHSLEKMGMSKAAAEDAVIITALMQAGNIAVWPVREVEKYKTQIVGKIGDAIGEKVNLDAVEHEPKQSWGSLIKSRLVAWGVVFASFRGAAALLGAEKFGEFESKFSEHIVCKPLGKPTHIAGAETKLFRMGKIAALDSFATAAAATLLYVGSRIFAKNEQEEERLHAAPPSPPPAAPVASTPCPTRTCPLDTRMPQPEVMVKSVAGKQELQHSHS